MVGVNSYVSGISGQTYFLEKEIGNGGEGNVFTIRGSQIVAKIYKSPSSLQHQKLLYMMYHHIPNLYDASGTRILTLAWPSDVLFDAAGQFIGYTMPLIDTGIEVFEICRGCTSTQAKKLFPHYSWALNITVAHNLAIAVDYLHSQHCIIGDMNCKNIFVNTDGTISILDADSFDLTDYQSNVHFKCCAATEDYLSPELQGRNLRAESSKFTTYSDYFALAIHIFQLLISNYHPFNCRQLSDNNHFSGSNLRLRQIRAGKSPFINRYPDVDIPLGAPMLAEVVPHYIQEDFVQTFNYTEQTIYHCITSRTTARKWAEDLSHLLWECTSPNGLIPCGDHYYLSSIGQCGICNAQSRYKASYQTINDTAQSFSGMQSSVLHTKKEHSVPNSSSTSPSPESASSQNPRIPSSLFRILRIYNLFAIILLLHCGFTAFSSPFYSVISILFNSSLIVGIIRMEHFRYNALNHSHYPFSGTIADCIYKIWIYVERCVFFLFGVFLVTLFCVMILEKLPLSGTVKLAFALIPIVLNRICFLLKVNE